MNNNNNEINELMEELLQKNIVKARNCANIAMLYALNHDAKFESYDECEDYAIGFCERNLQDYLSFSVSDFGKLIEPQLQLLYNMYEEQKQYAIQVAYNEINHFMNDDSDDEMYNRIFTEDEIYSEEEPFLELYLED